MVAFNFPKKIKFNIYIKEELYDQLHEVAERESTSLGEVIMEFLRVSLEEYYRSKEFPKTTLPDGVRIVPVSDQKKKIQKEKEDKEIEDVLKPPKEHKIKVEVSVGDDKPVEDVPRVKRKYTKRKRGIGPKPLVPFVQRYCEQEGCGEAIEKKYNVSSYRYSKMRFCKTHTRSYMVRPKEELPSEPAEKRGYVVDRNKGSHSTQAVCQWKNCPDPSKVHYKQAMYIRKHKGYTYHTCSIQCANALEESLENPAPFEL